MRLTATDWNKLKVGDIIVWTYFNGQEKWSLGLPVCTKLKVATNQNKSGIRQFEVLEGRPLYFQHELVQWGWCEPRDEFGAYTWAESYEWIA